MEYFKHYIFGQRFIVYTDHRPLIAIWRLKETSPTLTRLRLKLQGLECSIRYKQGSENIVADFLSRLSDGTCQGQESAPHRQIAMITRRQKRLQEQQQDAQDKLNDTIQDFNAIDVADVTNGG